MTEKASRTFGERSIWWRVGADFLQSKVAIFGLVVLALVVLAAIAAPWITPQNPYDLMQLDVLDARLHPGTPSSEGGYTYWLGTDGQGRDLYSAIVNVVLTLVLLEWAYYARTARGQALVETRREYVEAARGQGIPRWRILTGHILPNCLPPLLVIGALQIARAITLEATLSFLGLGVPITEPSLGLLISNGYQYLLSNEYWISFFPGIALLATIVAINLVGDQLRDVLNPRLQK